LVSPRPFSLSKKKKGKTWKVTLQKKKKKDGGTSRSVMSSPSEREKEPKWTQKVEKVKVHELWGGVKTVGKKQNPLEGG